MADLLGLDFAAPAPQPPPAALPPVLQLRPSPQLSPADFQRLWVQLPAAATFAVALSPAAVSALQTRQLVRLANRAALPRACLDLLSAGLLRCISAPKEMELLQTPCTVAQAFTEAMGTAGVVRMASGGNPPKFYFHAQPLHSDERILVEALSSGGGLNVTVKAEDAAVAPFQQLFGAKASQFH